jgi:DNA-binding SARP family transcriptional activator/pimeloyl-ACP methyl ester carboxylesterase/class 3 adenylate cyclase
VEFRVLGPIEVIDRGEAVAVGGVRARAVLAMLLLNANRVVSADRLAGELWPDLEPARAAANLQVRLAELRRALRSAGEADRLVTRPPGYLFLAAADELDVLRFERLAAAGRAALAAGDAASAARLLTESLALWRGPALADLGDAAFTGTERARLQEARLDAVESRVDALLACGRHQETLAELGELTAEHPLRERFWAQRLLALYRSGRQADALRAYRELRAVLTEQLGIEPGPELRQLEGRILRQDRQLDYRPLRASAGDDSARPVTRYVDSGGIHIAYQVLGAGPRDIVFVPGAMSHLDLLWEDAETAAFFRRLATLGRLILFDKRDTGLSDRAPADSPLEERMDDVRAVMEAASSSQAVLFGYSEGAPMSILVAALILGAATARYRWAPDYPCGQGSAEMFGALEEIASHRWGQGATIEWFLPSRAGSPEARGLFGRFERMAASPSAFLRIVRMIRQIDVRAVLPAIRVPTLVIQRLDDRMTPPCHGRYLAAHIAGARYFEQRGDHSLRFAASGDSDALIDEIRDFLTSAPRPRDPGRVLAAILLAEAVDRPPTAAATGRAAAAAGQPLAETGQPLAEQRVRSCRGRLITSTRASVLATFTAPGQAIRCAAALRDDAAARGIALRAGIHAGEVDLVGDDIAGSAVQVTRSITALAQPAEILVSRAVKDLVLGTGIVFTDRGPHELSGIGDSWPLFAVTRAE